MNKFLVIINILKVNPVDYFVLIRLMTQITEDLMYIDFLYKFVFKNYL